MTKRSTRAKRTKDQLIDEIEALESKYSNAEAPDPTAAALAKEAANKARTTARGLSVDSIVANGAAFGLEVQRTIASVTEQAVAKAEELKALQEAIAAETAELERLYELDVASASVAALVAAHAEERAKLEKARDEHYAAWNEEIVAHNKSVAQRNAETEAARKKEAAEYEYNTSQARKRAEEEWRYRLDIEKRNEAERVAAVNKDLDIKRAFLAEAQSAFDVEKARVAKLVEEAEKAAEARISIAVNAKAKELNTQFALEKKDLQSQLALELQRVASLQDQLSATHQDVAHLQKQLEDAKKQVTDITLEALKASSGQQALSSMQAFAKDVTAGRVSKA